MSIDHPCIHVADLYGSAGVPFLMHDVDNRKPRACLPLLTFRSPCVLFGRDLSRDDQTVFRSDYLQNRILYEQESLKFAHTLAKHSIL